MDTFFQDIRYGVRMLLKNPGFTAVAVITLALGIGANTAIFSLVNSIVLRPLPFAESHELMQVWHVYAKLNMSKASVSVPAYKRFKEKLSSFDDMTSYSTYRAPQNLAVAGGAVRVQSYVTTASFFSTLGVQPEIGRAYRQDEETVGQHRVAVLSYGLWQRQFGGDREILNRSVRLDGVEYQVVGVMPRTFQFPDKFDLLTPLALTPEQQAEEVEFMDVIGRLRNGVTREQAASEMAAVAGELRKELNIADEGSWTATIVPLHEELVGDVKPALMVLLGAVGCVLLIACANVANLLLARSAARQKEIAIRGALGASALRITRQLLTEGVLLGLLGGMLGLAIGYWGLDALLALSPVEPASYFAVGIDRSVLLFTFALSIVTGLLFAAVPAWQLSRGALQSALKESGTTSNISGHARARMVLVVAQTAVAVVLLVGAGLLIKSFFRLQQADAGFNPDHLLTATVGLQENKYRDPQQVAQFFERLRERLQAVPGVQTAAMSTILPFQTNWGNSFTIPGKQLQPDPHAFHAVATPTFRDALGLRLIRGRWFEERDQANAPKVVVIEESVAQLYWPGEDALGKQIVMATPGGTSAPREIVGILAPMKHRGAMVVEKKGMIYHPLAQVPLPFGNIVLRTSGRPEDLTAAIKTAVSELDPDQAVFNVRTGEDIMGQYSAAARLNMALLTVFATVALVLAMVGIYGVVSYTVTQRTREVGVRMALGAQPASVLRMFLREGVLLAVVGIAIGLVAALALGRFLAGLLFQVRPTDPLSYVAVALVLGSVALLASLIPARRATRVDPMIALRYE